MRQTPVCQEGVIVHANQEKKGLARILGRDARNLMHMMKLHDFPPYLTLFLLAMV